MVEYMPLVVVGMLCFSDAVENYPFNDEEEQSTSAKASRCMGAYLKRSQPGMRSSRCSVFHLVLIHPTAVLRSFVFIWLGIDTTGGQETTTARSP